ncbi:MAG: MBL fold metallo-hydrolase [Acidobacteria bacterium]|nr:MBL fold metallo-hydrolase [Acidobacteriota bacterium]
MTAAVRLTTVYDNYEHDPRLRAGWGFSCLVEAGDRKILFDTGADRMTEMFNIERLEIDLKQVGAIFLSHAHCDHVGGLTSVLEAASGPKVYLGLRSPLSLKERVRSGGGEPVAVKGLTQVFENVHSTGEMGGSIREQSMVVRTKKGLVVITGCAHPAIVEIARRVKEQFKEKIHLMIGGFHLGGLSDAEINTVISHLKGLNVERVAPCHCTGERARGLFAQAYGENYLANGVGKVIQMGES